MFFDRFPRLGENARADVARYLPLFVCFASLDTQVCVRDAVYAPTRRATAGRGMATQQFEAGAMSASTRARLTAAMSEMMSWPARNVRGSSTASASAGSTEIITASAASITAWFELRASNTRC